MTEQVFDENYYERGVATGVSGYTNYHWKPEYCLPLANYIKNSYLIGNRVLDFGCAKGYLVKAFRMLGVDAVGYDRSEYAIANCDPRVQGYVSTTYPEGKFDCIVAKDVLEHVPKNELVGTLQVLAGSLDEYGELFVIVPLGDDGVFRIREYELDKTHVVKEDEEFWLNVFTYAGLTCQEFHYSLEGAKDHWVKVHPFGNAIFILRRTKKDD